MKTLSFRGLKGTECSFVAYFNTLFIFFKNANWNTLRVLISIININYC